LARFRLFDAVDSFLTRATREEPILLLLDDLHWADRSSLRLLEFVALSLRRSRLLLVAACRSTDGWLSDVVRTAGCRTLPLAGLEFQDIRSLMAEVLGEPPSRQLLRAVHDMTAGNPFFAAEIASWAARDRTVSDRREPNISIPESVKTVITRRLDRLTDDTRALLRIAAVIGPHIDAGVLLRLSGRKRRRRVLEALDEGIRAQLLHEYVSERQFGFRHAKIRQVLCDELSPGVRMRLYARIAAELEADYGAGAERHATELARHFAMAATRRIHKSVAVLAPGG
jgi:predicted ATPase